MDENYMDLSSASSVLLELRGKSSSAEEARKGALRSYTPDGDGSVYYDSGRSNYYTTVERVLSVDGWESSDDGKAGMQRMTLLILKIVVGCTADDGRVRSIKVTLKLDNQEGGGKAGPTIEAWAPFRKLETTNSTKALHKETTVTAAKAGAEAYGGSAQLERTVTSEITFDRTYFDKAFACPVMSGSRRSGIFWYMKQNDLENHGVQPETFVAILFKRETDDSYVIKFDIEVRGGTLYNLGKNIEKAFGLGPGHTKPFLEKPSKDIRVRGEGHDFLPAVENIVNNLGKLRARDSYTGLTIFRRPTVEGSVKTEAEGDGPTGVDKNNNGDSQIDGLNHDKIKGDESVIDHNKDSDS
ncbi:hypothetical protein ACHAPM_011197 [Fusarium culmorum]